MSGSSKMRFAAAFNSLALAIALSCTNCASQSPQPSLANNHPQAAGESPSPGSAKDVAAPAAEAAPATGGVAKANETQPPAGNAGTKSTTADTVAQQVKDVKAIKDALNADSDLDFS